MTRQQRRAAERRAAKMARADAIARTIDHLANIAGPTATGATLIMPEGEPVYISAETARAMTASKSTGKAQ